MAEQYAGPSMEFFLIPVYSTTILAKIPIHALLANNKNQTQITIKLAEPKQFNGNTMQACTWVLTLKHYFIVVGIAYTATKAADTEAACQYAVVLISGNTARWMDRLEVQGHAPNSFPEFEKLFIN